MRRDQSGSLHEQLRVHEQRFGLQPSHSLERDPVNGIRMCAVELHSSEELVGFQPLPVFVEPDQITGINSRFRRIYDDWAPFYDLLSRVGLYILGVSEYKLRREFIEKLEINGSDRLLATSVGTASAGKPAGGPAGDCFVVSAGGSAAGAAWS